MVLRRPGTSEGDDHDPLRFGRRHAYGGEFSGIGAHQHGPQIHLRQVLARPEYSPQIISSSRPSSPPGNHTS